MAAARRSYPGVVRSPPRRPDSPPRRGGPPSPTSHPAWALGRSDADGSYRVRSRRRWRRRSPPRPSRAVPAALVGLCFNCLANKHIKAECVFPAKCFNCRCEGHRSSVYPLPPATTGAKRGRSPPTHLVGGGLRPDRRQDSAGPLMPRTTRGPRGRSARAGPPLSRTAAARPRRPYLPLRLRSCTATLWVRLLRGRRSGIRLPHAPTSHWRPDYALSSLSSPAPTSYRQLRICSVSRLSRSLVAPGQRCLRR